MKLPGPACKGTGCDAAGVVLLGMLVHRSTTRQP